MNVQAPLWRSIAVFRFASLVYAAVVLFLVDQAYLLRALGLGVGRAGWDDRVDGRQHDRVYSVPARRTRLLLAADLIVTVLCAALDRAAADPGLPHPDRGHAGHRNLARRASPGLGGHRSGARGPARWPPWVIGGCTVSHAQAPAANRGVSQTTALDGPIVVLMPAAMLVGYVFESHDKPGQAGIPDRATEIEAASRERERLARTIHDSVLQVLAMVQRRGTEAGGEAAEIGRLAGEQEAALRALVTPYCDGLALRFRPASLT